MATVLPEGLNATGDGQLKKEPTPLTVQAVPPGLSLCCPWKDNPEKVGVACARAGNQPIFINQFSILAAVLQLATQEAGCFITSDTRHTDDDYTDYKCNGTVLGQSPEDIISLMLSVGGIMTALMVPIVGAIIDGTPHRRRIYGITVTTMIVANLCQAGITRHWWFGVILIQAFITAPGSTFAGAMLGAYVPEVCPDHVHELPRFVTFMRTIEMCLLILQLLIGAISGGPGRSIWPNSQHAAMDAEENQLGAVAGARLAVIISVAISGPLYWRAYQRLGDRPAAIEIKGSLIAHGFKKIGSGFIELSRDFKVARNVLMVISFSMAGTGVIITYAVIYLVIQLGMTGSDVNYFATALLVIGVPTTVAMGKMDVLAKLGPKKALQCPLVLFMVTMPAFAFICQTPATKPIAWFFAIPFGVAFGWFYPAARSIWYALIPGGREVEWMGYYEFSCACLAWAPPLIIIGVRNAFGSLTVAVASIFIWFGTALAILTFCVDMEKAKAQVEPTLKSRRSSNFGASDQEEEEE